MQYIHMWYDSWYFGVKNYHLLLSFIKLYVEYLSALCLTCIWITCYRAVHLFLGWYLAEDSTLVISASCQE